MHCGLLVPAMLARVAATLVVLGVGVALAGCYASTEPASNITVNEAVLNARGTANEGAAYSYFEYWPTAKPSDKRTTGQRQWPAGASGPFSDSVHRLAVATSYSFHLCGGDQGQPPVCAQTRSFQTVRPPGDLVYGSALGGGPFPSPGNQVFINASSDPSGANPKGSLQGLGAFEGYVTCLKVQGNRAAVGAVGQDNTEQPHDDAPEGLLFELIDGGDGGDDLAKQTLTQGATPPNCASATFTNLSSPPYSELVVYDAP
jgi:hypothetical protein